MSCDVSLETEQEHRQGAAVSARFEPMKLAPPVTMERMIMTMVATGLAVSEWCLGCLVCSVLVPIWC